MCSKSAGVRKCGTGPKVFPPSHKSPYFRVIGGHGRRWLWLPHLIGQSIGIYLRVFVESMRWQMMFLLLLRGYGNGYE